MNTVKEELMTYVNSEKALFYPKFFQTHPGGYGEGDRFLGIVIPDLRKVAKGHAHRLALQEMNELLQDPFHEVRMLALFMMILRYEKPLMDEEKERIVHIYLNHLDRLNNWDLVDASAHKILGAHLLERDRSLLDELAHRDHLWSQRVAIISTLAFIPKNQFDDTLRISEILLHHPHDLIHKAVGWMLREVGKRDLRTEMTFLDRHYPLMPRTMLRYAIEKFDEDVRQSYLKGTR